MSPTLSIASVTLREVLRRKVQVNLLFFGGALIVASFLVSNLTIGEGHRILADLGLTSMQIIGVLVAVFIGSTLISGDVDRRVLQPVVAKPIGRYAYVLGRYLGLAAALLLNLAIMSAVLAAVLCWERRSLAPLDRSLLAAFALLGVQFLAVDAVAVLFSAISSTTLAAIFSLAIAIAGQLIGEVRALWPADASWVPQVIWYFLPNLGALNANESVIYRTAPPAQAWLAAAQALLYTGAVLALASFSFERKDLR